MLAARVLNSFIPMSGYTPQSKTSNIIFLAVILLISLTACKGSYSFNLFSFPPNTKPHENHWTYLGKIVVYDNPAFFSTKPPKKTLEISISDTQGNTLLTDKVNVVGVSFRYHIEWEASDNLLINVSESGQSASNPLVSLNYQLKNNKFIAVH